MGKWWGQPERGIIGDNHEVTFNVGLGENEGHTVIADGFMSKSYFHGHHDHYGPDNRNPGGGRIEDSKNGGHRGYYTGPGC